MTVHPGTLLAASRSEAGFARIQQIASAQVIARWHDEATARLAMTVHPVMLLAASRSEGNNAKSGSKIEGDVFVRRRRTKIQ